MNIDQGQYNILRLARDAYNGEIMLPDFQRNFVWPRSSVEEFIESLLEDMFVGTFLIMQTSAQTVPFKAMYVEGADEVNKNISPKPRILILDGQQRLTAVFYAMYSPNIPLKNTEKPYAFFIDLNKLMLDLTDESVISWSKDWYFYREMLTEDGKYDYEKLMERKLLPMTAFAQQDLFYDLWYTRYKRLFSDDEADHIFAYLHNLVNYNVLTLTLGNQYNDKPEEVAALFEKLNRTGIKLSIYDLLVARLYKFINLREQWEKVFDTKPNIKEFAGYINNTNVPFSFIQALALASGKSIKTKEIIKIDQTVINEQSWDKVADIFENKVLKGCLSTRYGVADYQKWVPYRLLATMLAAFFLEYDYPNVNKLDTWYWSSIFSERYSSSTETMMMRDFKDVCEWINDTSKVPEFIQNFRIQLQSAAYTFKDVKKPNSSKYIGVFNLLFRNEAKDFYRDAPISFNELEDHHIFPRNFIRRHNANVEEDSVLNRTLILDKTNREISNKSPAEFIIQSIKNRAEAGKIPESQAEADLKESLKAHFIDEEMYLILKGTDDLLTTEQIEVNFTRFIEKREELIKERIQSLIN